MALLKNVPVLRRALEIGYTMFLIILLSVLVGLILAFPVMWLWNFVFGELLWINVFQAWALTVLCSILVGSKSANGKKK